MRILQVSPYYHPHAGGVESHVRAISTEFARLGHEVTVLTSRYAPGLPSEETREGVRVVRARTRAVLWNTPVDSGVRRLVQELPADVVHVHYPPPLTAYYVARGLRHRAAPLCLTYHCDLFLPGLLGGLATRLYERLFLPATFRRVSRFVVHTRSYGATSRALRNRPLTIIPSSVDLDRFQPGPPDEELRARLGLEDRRVLAFTGRLVPHKGLDALLRALPLLPNDVSLLVIGQGPRLDALMASARRLNVEERTRFCPGVSDHDLPAYLRLAEMFVFPSENRLEGFGLAVAEAMAVGLPVVIADLPGVREVIEPGREGLLAEPMIPGDLARRIQELLDDPGTRRAMGRAGRERAEARYGVQTVAAELLSVYRSLSAAG